MSDLNFDMMILSRRQQIVMITWSPEESYLKVLEITLAQKEKENCDLSG